MVCADRTPAYIKVTTNTRVRGPNQEVKQEHDSFCEHFWHFKALEDVVMKDMSEKGQLFLDNPDFIEDMDSVSSLAQLFNLSYPDVFLFATACRLHDGFLRQTR